jgi:hypothetical protein
MSCAPLSRKKAARARFSGGREPMPAKASARSGRNGPSAPHIAGTLSAGIDSAANAAMGSARHRSAAPAQAIIAAPA